MIFFYNLTNIPENINYPDIYFTPEYGKACQYSDDAIWELCQYKDLIYVYLKKSYIFENITYYDLLSPYGYSGYYFIEKKTLDEFIKLFRIEANKRNYLTEVVRQNPYLNIDISKYYDIISSKKIFSVEIDNYEYYYTKILNSKKRNMINKSIKLNFSNEIIKLKEKFIKKYFLNLYNNTMNKVNSSSYYYFNDNYYNQIEKIKNSYLINIYNEQKNIIGCSILFIFNNFIHYHLSCNDNSSNCITDYLLNSVIKEFGINKKIIIGCGLKDNDTLYDFKKKISTNNYDYIIYKNILNKEIYDKIKNLYKEDNYFPIHKK
jgi:hypothetical protein